MITDPNHHRHNEYYGGPGTIQHSHPHDTDHPMSYRAAHPWTDRRDHRCVSDGGCPSPETPANAAGAPGATPGN